jgi:hypothetical protein
MRAGMRDMPIGKWYDICVLVRLTTGIATHFREVGREMRIRRCRRISRPAREPVFVALRAGVCRPFCRVWPEEYAWETDCSDSRRSVSETPSLTPASVSPGFP